jgi:hypothetical protein
MKFSAAQRYRFFVPTGRKMAHERSVPRPSPPRPIPQAPCSPGAHSGGPDCAPGGHIQRPAVGSDLQLLLPLRGVACSKRVREDVRVAEVCFTLVGQFLREAPPAGAQGKSRREPAVAASRPRRTRAAVKNRRMMVRDRLVAAIACAKYAQPRHRQERCAAQELQAALRDGLRRRGGGLTDWRRG